jgi:all-trans-nonaprenyl-diphosphate synthase
MAEQPFLATLIEREFAEASDFDQAIELIHQGNGIQKSRDLAAEQSRLAVECLASLPPSAAKQALQDIADYVLRRVF